MKDPVFEMDDEEIDVSLPPDKRFEMEESDPVSLPIQSMLYPEIDCEVVFYPNPIDDSPTTLVMLAETLVNIGKSLHEKGLLKPTLPNGLNNVNDWQAFKEITSLSNEDLQSLSDKDVITVLSENCFIRLLFKIQSITFMKRHIKHQVG